MPRYFFDVRTGDVTETDAVGNELTSLAMITDLALDLCLQIARERLPDGSNVWVRVRVADGPTLYESKIMLSGSWT